MQPELTLPPMPQVGKRRAIRVTKDALRHIRKGHPWVYDASIVSGDDGGSAGDLAVVFDDKRAFAAIGLLDPASPIRIKILHHGKPATIDQRWWRAQTDRALQQRRILFDDDQTTGFRLINGENDGFPGLVVDRYGTTLVAKVYTAAWFPHIEAVLGAVLGALRDLGVDSEQLVVRLGRSVQDGECHGLEDGSVVLGTAAEPVDFLEHGLRFQAHPRSGQKTGFFLDQRDNRNRVRAMARRATVLDVFSCTGGFSVAAAAGGAREVTSVDVSRWAIETAEANMAANRSIGAVANCRWNGIVGDAFAEMERLRREGHRFDLVIVDPPSFAQRQANISAGLRAYRRLTELAVALVEPGGRLVQASCSSRITADAFYDAVLDTAAQHGRPLEELARTGHAVDHPVSFDEGNYLKALFAEVGVSPRRP